MRIDWWNDFCFSFDLNRGKVVCSVDGEKEFFPIFSSLPADLKVISTEFIAHFTFFPKHTNKRLQYLMEETESNIPTLGSLFINVFDAPYHHVFRLEVKRWNRNCRIRFLMAISSKANRLTTSALVYFLESWNGTKFSGAPHTRLRQLWMTFQDLAAFFPNNGSFPTDL